MANTQPFRMTPQLGPQLDTVSTGVPGWEAPGITTPSPQLGTKEVGNDGHDYIWVQASAAISAAAGNGTQIVVDEPAMTAAAGSGGWYTQTNVAIAINQYFWARKGALDAM